MRCPVDEDIVFPFNNDIPPAIPDGEDYQLGFLRAEQSSYRGRLKVYLWFQMITEGEWFGQKFYMCCNVIKKGKWTAACKFWQAWVLATGQRPMRADRMSTSVFRNKVFRARMRTVRKTATQAERTPAQRYSVVDELLEVMAGRS
jgi:hypothetical protein